MKKVLIFMGRYLPGYKDGGPIRTIVNVTEILGDEFDFYIACYDRDHGDSDAYLNIKYNEWNKIGKAKVFYVKPGMFTQKLILKLAAGMDIIYLCNFYESYGYKTLFLKRIGKIKIPIALASMGVFSKEAQAQKALKKRIFLSFCQIINLFKGITWSFSSEIEANDAKNIIGKNIKYIIAEDLPRPVVPGKKNKSSDRLKIIFLSRICEHKNPEIVIDAINNMKNKCVEVGFYGPIQDNEYWNKCLKKLETVNFKWWYGGDVKPELVQDTISNFDVLMLPSKSENYGHVIFEALSVGCIPVISDRTPWNEIESIKCGFICKLTSESFSSKLDEIIEMDKYIREEIQNNAVIYARTKVENARKKTGYRTIFNLKE